MTTSGLAAATLEAPQRARGHLLRAISELELATAGDGADVEKLVAAKVVTKVAEQLLHDVVRGS